ncbi:MAG: carboxypeptidase regulatory-like domain-containing protein [Candidatus Omnitrophica bacterium]|nr:carboxypeptidase regulatory-like domain-containing protein [Candidatus Omnitrophota bacterium]
MTRTQGRWWMIMLITALLAGARGPMVWAADGATVSGNVAFAGTPPTRKPLNFGAEKQCAIAHGDQMPMGEEIVVNGNGTLKNVLVYVTSTVPGTYAPPATPVTYAQTGCVFLPHVAAAMAGQPIEVINNDDVLHNVRAQSKLGQRFNIAQPTKGMKTTKVMQQQEIGIPLKCDVHYWMVAYLHVLAHPFFAVTGDDGAFTIKDLPPGTYTLEAWHEKLGTRQAPITVQAGQSSTADFTFGS